MIMRNVRFLSWLLRFFTFSSRKALGFLSRRIRFISKNRVPCVGSSNPCGIPRDFFFDTPEMEKGWHGKPATRMSCFGISELGISRILPFGFSPKLAS